MELLSIGLRHFKRFKRFEASFSKGLNIIKGPNEAGKSTLQQAILLGLFDRPTGKQSERRYQSWGSERRFSIDLTYRLPEGKEVRIRKDYESGECEVLSPEGRDGTRSGLEKAIQAALGTTSEKLFVSTACIRQDAMSAIEGGRAEIGRELQRIVMGSDVAVDEVIMRLSQNAAELERGWKTTAPKNPGPVARIQSEIKEITDRLGRIRPEVDGREQAKEELLGERQRLAKLEADLAPIRELLDIHTRRVELKQALDRCLQEEKELEARLEKIGQAEGAMKKVETELCGFTGFDRHDPSQQGALDRVYGALQVRTAEAADRRALMQELSRRAELHAKPSRSQIRIALGSMALGMALGIGCLLLARHFQPEIDSAFYSALIVLGGILGLGGLASPLIFFLWRFRRDRALRTMLGEAHQRYQEGLQAKEQAEGSLAKALEPFQCHTWEEYQQAWGRFQQLDRERREAEAALGALLYAGESRHDLSQKRERLSRARRDCQEQLAEMAAIPDLSPMQFQKLVGERGRLEGEMASCQAQILRLEAKSEGNGHTLEDVLALQERQAALNRRLEHALERYEVISLTLKGLTQARDLTLRNAQQALIPRLNAYLARLTNGQYMQALVDEGLQIGLLHASKEGGPITMEEVSSGTQDQVYLAARLALCELIFEGRHPPLLMDDPFVKFDPQRREAALRLCQELAADWQILLFTCHDGYDPYADQIVVLE